MLRERVEERGRRTLADCGLQVSKVLEKTLNVSRERFQAIHSLWPRSWLRHAAASSQLQFETGVECS